MTFELTLGSSDPADLRALGLTVSVHNDYRAAGEPHTFWLFTTEHTGRSFKGEGRSDSEALDQVRKQVSSYLHSPLTSEPRGDAQVVEQTNVLAHKFYDVLGYKAPDDFRFYTAERGRERTAWEMARLAQLELTATDPNDALDNLGLEHAR